MKPDSIRLRVALWSATFIALSLAVGWFVLTSLLAGFVERRVTLELDAIALGVLSTATWDGGTTLQVFPAPADPRFTPPYSGWYWQVDDGSRVVAQSRSLATSTLGVGASMEVDREGRSLLVHRRQGTAPGSSAVLTVAVTMPEAVVQAELAGLTRPLLVWTLFVGFALLAAAVLGSVLGQRALVRVGRDLVALRRGEVDALADPGVEELRPFTTEVNQLIADRRTVVERSRAHVGNLAHALKTPLAVLQNREEDEEKRSLLARMERTLRWHLGRARAVGLQGGSGMRASVEEVLQDVVLVLGHEAERRGLRLEAGGGKGVVFAGEAEDLAEIIGNVAENAVRYAGSNVSISIDESAERSLRVTIRDDGPGIPEAQRQMVMSRGVTSSDSQAGTGLGLAIVADLVGLYEGQLELREASSEAPHGLEVVLTLPAV